ncbi:MAG: nucleoside-triphosphatase [Candidatus Poseidoniia archaeon]|jgi:nucleoside-triphosphatase
MGIHPKIGITGLPRSGKSAVMAKVVKMLGDERRKELMNRGHDLETIELIGGMRTEPIVVDGQRVGYKCISINTGDEGVMAHKDIDSRLRILGFGIDTTELERVGVPAIEYARDNCEIIVIDEIGKYAVESDDFVQAVRSALEADKPTIMALHKKSRHPLLQDIRRRDDARILEVTPVNRALLPYKIHKLMRETY